MANSDQISISSGMSRVQTLGFCHAFPLKVMIPLRDCRTVDFKSWACHNSVALARGDGRRRSWVASRLCLKLALPWAFGHRVNGRVWTNEDSVWKPEHRRELSTLSTHHRAAWKGQHFPSLYRTINNNQSITFSLDFLWSHTVQDIRPVFYSLGLEQISPNWDAWWELNHTWFNSNSQVIPLLSFVWVGRCSHTTVHMCSSENNFKESSPSFHPVSPRNRTQVITLGHKCLHQLSHLTGHLLILMRPRTTV